MHKNRLQSDGKMRDSDNWQNGFGFPVLMKSMWRHLKDSWTIHRGHEVIRIEKGETVKIDLEEALCGLMFNTMGYLHEHLTAMKNMDHPERDELLREFLKVTNEWLEAGDILGWEDESNSDQKT